MSASKLRSTHYYSPLRIEADQKEVIIAQMKDQIVYLRKNENQYFVLQDQYKKLDHRFRLLSEEKAICDVDFRERHEMAMKNICALKAELDNLRAVLRERTLQLDDFQTDSSTLRTQIDQRLIEIEKLQNELRSLCTDAQELACERNRLQETASQVRADNERHLNNIRHLQIQNDRISRDTDQTEKYFEKLRIQQKILKEKIINFQHENNSLDDDINRVMDDLAAIDLAIGDAQSQVKNLQTDIAEASALCDKYKSQALHLYKATQSQIMRNNDCAKQLSHADSTLKTRGNQVEVGRREIANLHEENNNLDQANCRLEDDMEFCRKHLENLALSNSELVMNLEQYSQEDQVVRSLIDRKKRVVYSRVKVQQLNGMMARTTIRESPSKIYY